MRGVLLTNLDKCFARSLRHELFNELQWKELLWRLIPDSVNIAFTEDDEDTFTFHGYLRSAVGLKEYVVPDPKVDSGRASVLHDALIDSLPNLLREPEIASLEIDRIF